MPRGSVAKECRSQHVPRPTAEPAPCLPGQWAPIRRSRTAFAAAAAAAAGSWARVDPRSQISDHALGEAACDRAADVEVASPDALEDRGIEVRCRVLLVPVQGFEVVPQDLLVEARR